MTIERDSLLSLPVDLEDQLALRQVLARFLAQIDLIVGLRGVQGASDYTAVNPGVVYSQTEAARIAVDLSVLYDRVAKVEARLVPVSNTAL